MKILVIGSKGFIGSHCTAHLSELGYDVIGCDIHESEDTNYISLKSITNDFNQLFSKQKFNYCINAAGSAHVNYSFEFPEKDFDLNVSLVINVLGAIKNNTPNCKFINFSSAAVYGNPSILPIAENAKTNPLSPYGYHKLLSENLLLEYHRFFHLQTCSLRVFSAYGEGLRKQLFWDLYSKTKESVHIQLFGSGMESRDFIYISDLVEIVNIIIQKAKFEGEIYNIANGEEIYIKDAVNLFIKEYKWNGKITFSGKEKPGDPLNWKADIKKIQSLGYKIKYSFSEGIKNYCQWLKDLK
ncbi:MAG: NAD-dependent epimerase/dehydratase family protein [Bacteroidota bacterium]